MSSAQPQRFSHMDIQAVIERTRRDLLELSARNRLVHTPLDGKRASWLEIHDERTDDLFDVLVKRQKSMTFASTATLVTEANDHDQLTASNVQNESVDNIERAGAIEPEESGYRDLVLQTTLSADKLHDRLLKTLLDAKTSEEEQGVSILFLACGFLKWREAQNSKVDRYAPLLLIPVELSRSTARSKFRLRFRDEEIITNLSVQARLKQEFGIVLPSLPESIADDEDWKPSDYFAQINDLIKDREGWSILENKTILWFFSFTKFLMFRDLSPETWPETYKLEDHPLITSLLAGGFVDDSRLPPPIGEDEPLDTKLSVADVVHVTDADSSQAIVVHEIAQGRNLVVQGPPGTGKSQTITNAIAAAVHAGKRVLFVAEKMAALEVVKRRLDQIGLGPMTLQLHSHKARKREVLEDLKATMESGVPTATRNVSVDDLRKIAIQLRGHDAALHSPIGNSGRSPFQAIGQFLRLRGLGYDTLPFKVPVAADWEPSLWNECRSLGQELDKLLKVTLRPDANAWYGTGCSTITPADHERLNKQIADVLPLLSDLSVVSNHLADLMRMDHPTTIQQVSLLAELACLVIAFPKSADRSTLRAPIWENVQRVSALLDNLEELAGLRTAMQGKLSEAAYRVDLVPVRIAIAAYGKSFFRIFRSSYRSAAATLRGILREPPPKGVDAQLQLIDQIMEMQAIRTKIEHEYKSCQAAFGKNWDDEYTDIKTARATAQWIQAVQAVPLFQSHAVRLVEELIDERVLGDASNAVSNQVTACTQLLNAIATTLKLDFAKAFAAADSSQVPVANWQAKLSRWLKEPEQLSQYGPIHHRLSRMSEMGLTPLVATIECGATLPGQVIDHLEQIRSDAIIDAAWHQRIELREFHGQAFEELRKRFATLDQERIALSRLQVAQAHYAKLPSTLADGGQVSIVRREINKKRRHLPIRQLINEAGHAIQKAKPVFMMSPLSVAQYLTPGAVEFDLLVIDEASQVQPVDALGAIARCKQIVVVGDQRQLPPSNFFGRVSGDVDEDDDQEQSMATDLESILGLCEAQGLQSRMLRWHYRSRHESLIAVSNRQFYENRLFIVPSPIVSGGLLGLKMRYIPDGWYDRGGTRVNRVEAIAVADAVMDHARNHPGLSLGVATFSNAQRDAIIDELELRRNKDASCEDFFAADGEEPFFVKSLENVQGDQRDVIFISIGYARDKDGYFAQNFGPLNTKGGERRLNVLISRAADACEVFTSIKAHDIDLNRTQSAGVAALKMYLSYAEFGRLESSRSTGEAHSIFEQQVAKALQDRGLQVDHHIGVGGFYIDLAIRDPDRDGRYLLGIECDGTQYHAARWVRDRDRLRQEILESRGWVIHHVWSTDWFQRPQEQAQRILDALDQARLHWNEIDLADAQAATIQSARNAKSDQVDLDSFWTRSEASPQQETITDDSDYKEADFSVAGFDGSASELPDDQLSSIMEKIVRIEAPIHVDEMGRRCIAILGSGRLTGTLKNRIGSVIELLETRNLAQRRGEFVYRPEQTEYLCRNRKNAISANLRKIEFIADEELSAAILTVVRESIGPDSSEIASSVARKLGLTNSAMLQAKLDQLIDQLQHQAVISERLGKLFTVQ